MRSYQVFAAMTPEEATTVLGELRKESPAAFRQAVDATALATKTRPVYLRRQPLEKRVQAVRRVMARLSANPVAEELLAVYFLECRKALLVEWLDLLGLAHEDGALEEEAPSPPAEADLRAAVEKFRSGGGEPDRELLLRAFAAQSAIDWPALDVLIGFGD